MLNKTYDKKVLLYSGGMDSWLINEIWKPDIKLYIDVGSSYAREEIERLPKDVIIDKLDLSKWELEDKIIPLRNLFLIGLATNYGNEICIGATAGDRVLDKSETFINKYQDLLCYLYQDQHWTEERSIKLNIDYKQYTKVKLLSLYLKEGGNIYEAFNSSFSCYSPISKNECWQCKPCFRKFVAFALNGFQFGEEIIQKNIHYIKTRILPSIEEGVYNRKQEEKEILKVLEIYRDYV